jgi:aspartyl-tRNA synthetase
LHEYRSHLSAELPDQVGASVRIAGWVHTVRDHGGVLFVDVRDRTGVTQVVVQPEDGEVHAAALALSKESTVSVDGLVRSRPAGTENPALASGTVEVAASSITVLGPAKELPFDPHAAGNVKEELRLRYRFLDLRSERLQRNLRTRMSIIDTIRREMKALGFLEVQTPILTSSSPEGARDYIVPSRRYPGRFYALPQAPQQFKQLLMTSGVERYFQIAPCFRDEDGRADRSPGEFYQLDLELAFATQEDVFAVVEHVFDRVWAEHSDRPRTPVPFPRLTYAEAMLKYGSDKPDLRNPLVITDLTDVFATSGFKAFAGRTVRAIRIPGGAAQGRKWFDRLDEYARGVGAAGLAFLKFEAEGAVSGSIANPTSDEDKAGVRAAAGVEDGDAVVFIAADKAEDAARIAGFVRAELGTLLDLVHDDEFIFCWIVDFPMYEWNEDEKQWDFSHNPFSMPQGGAAALDTDDLGSIKAFQYDVVCNGYELSSGAVRNHDPELMLKAFALAGYGPEVVESKFPALYNAFQYGAPPHAGIAPGIDRIVMLLTDEKLIRDVGAFPMTVGGRDLLMDAPNAVTDHQLRELHIRLAPGVVPDES